MTVRALKPLQKTAGVFFMEQKMIDRHYGFVYWDSTIPQKNISRRPYSWANPGRPLLWFQTGFYSAKFDLEKMAIAVNHIVGSSYECALKDCSFLDNEPIDYDPIELKFTVENPDKTKTVYKCKEFVVEDRNGLHVRLVESGRYVNKISLNKLIFTSENGKTVESGVFLDVTSWPDRLTFELDITRKDLNISQTEIFVGSSYGHSDSKKCVISVYDSGDELILDEINVDATDAVQNHSLVLKNDSKDTAYYKVQWDQTGTMQFITGLTMEIDGSDSPVQISKNWHKRFKNERYAGTWLHAYAVIPVEAKSTQQIKVIVYKGWYNNLPTSTHGQLCLIGYSKYPWQWDQAALGAWGESLTNDPYDTVAASFCGDIRPSMTTPLNGGTDLGWTENVGGLGLLSYFDEKGKYRWPSRIKTAYLNPDPSTSVIKYHGMSDDKKISFDYTISAQGSLEYHKRSFQIVYRFNEEVTSSRFLFFQIAADYYLLPEYVRLFYGDAVTVNKVIPRHGSNEYDTENTFTLSEGGWLCIEDLITSGVACKANRGIVIRKFKLNGDDRALHVHPRGRTWGRDTSTLDFSTKFVSAAFNKNDAIELDFDLVLPPKTANDYVGTDIDFRNRFHNRIKPWEIVQQEVIN